MLGVGQHPAVGIINGDGGLPGNVAVMVRFGGKVSVCLFVFCSLPSICKSKSESLPLFAPLRKRQTVYYSNIMSNTKSSESRLNSPISQRSSRRDILDDIRNDQELLLGDDPVEQDQSSPPSSSSNRLSQSSRLASFNRRTSLIPMDNLQREVDMALEMFSHENSDDEPPELFHRKGTTI